MDIVNAILIIEACARMKRDLSYISSWRVLLAAMDRPSPLFTSSMIYRGISCLKHLPLEDSNTRQYFKLMCKYIESSGVYLNANDVCPAIYSIQVLNNNFPEVKNLIQYLSKSLSQLTDTFQAKPICSAVYGLRKLRPTYEVRGLLSALADKMEESEFYYHSVNICIALNGLQNMDDSYPEVRRILSVLMDKAIAADEQGMDRVTDRAISMALFGKMRFRCQVYLSTVERLHS